MNRLLLSLTALSALLLAACGGSSSVQPPPPVNGFTTASLKGQYAFAMHGQNLNGAYIARVGSFTADGNGSITAAIEDLVTGNSGSNLITFTGGTYTVEPSGRGLLVLKAGNNSGLQLNFMLVSPAQGFLIETDLANASSGNFFLQTPADFAATSLNGSYVFDFAGVSFPNSTVAPISTIGQLKFDGNGNITSGLQDINDGNNGGNAPSGPQSISPGTYSLDPTNGPSSGRGTMTFAGGTFAFYIVDNSQIRVVEEDTSAASSGDALQQSSSIPTTDSAFTGSFASLVTGASVLGTQSTVAYVNRFTSDGNGGLGAIALDGNAGGFISHVSQGSNISNAKYAIDTSNAGSGRGTFQFTDSSTGTYTYVFYAISSSQFVTQNTSKGIIADGPLSAQSGSPFTNSNVTGNYAFSWAGVQLGTANAIPFDEDYAGQLALANSSSGNNVTGTTDYTEIGLSGQTLYSSTGLKGDFVFSGDGSSDNKMQLINSLSPSTTYNVKVYVVNPNTFFMVVIDPIRTTAGAAILQSTD